MQEGNLIEFLSRNTKDVTNQLTQLSNPTHPYTTNRKYYLNHRVEKLQNAISYLGYSIFELIDKNITDKNMLLNSILNAHPIQIKERDGSISTINPITILNEKLHTKNLSYVKRKLAEFINYIIDNKHTTLEQIIRDVNNLK